MNSCVIRQVATLPFKMHKKEAVSLVMAVIDRKKQVEIWNWDTDFFHMRHINRCKGQIKMIGRRWFQVYTGHISSIDGESWSVLRI